MKLNCKFLEYLKRLKVGNELPFEIINSNYYFENLDNYFFPNASERLLPFGKEKSGSLLCFYRKNENPVGNENELIVWLDSEAFPIVLISKNLKELFSILPFGLGFIYDLSVVVHKNLENLNSVINPSITKRELKIKEQLQETILEKNSYLFYVRNKFNVEIADSPFEIIKEVNNNNLDFHKWVKKGLSSW